MMKLILIATTLMGFASFSFTAEKINDSLSGKEQAMLLLKAIEKDNSQYIRNHQKSFFADKIGQHKPNITFVGCSDARVQTELFNDSSVGEIFSIRNIGNQISTAQGSVKYGVNHLKTRLLLIIGHTQCGAVITARSDYQHLEPSLVSELNSLHVRKDGSEIDAIKDNVNDQVNLSLKLFANQVSHDELLIVGAVYDFGNEMKKGAGKLNIINIQGKKIDN